MTPPCVRPAARSPASAIAATRCRLPFTSTSCPDNASSSFRRWFTKTPRPRRPAACPSVFATLRRFPSPRPTPYRLRRGGKLLYRQPAFLLSTDLELPLERLLQYYLWRWDIEVNHRDEKQLIGVGQAQVRTPRSADRQPALAVASYTYLLLAALRVYGVSDRSPSVAVPKWQRKMKPPRVSTPKLLRELRSEIWAQAIERLQYDRLDRLKTNSTDFVNAPSADMKCQKPEFPIESAAIFAWTG